MGIFNVFKKKIKLKYEAQKAAYKERKEYEKELTKKIIASRRKAFEKEAIRQAAIKAKLSAKLKFNPPKPKQIPMLHDAMFGGTPKKKKQSKAAYDLIWKS